MDLRKRILKRVDELRGELVEISKFIHANPELGYHEKKASECLIAHLKKHGFNVEYPVKGVKYAFRASVRGGKKGPAIGFISEYDALPEIGHACGHNLIAASGFGAAAALAPFIKELGGSVYLFGTPAEECDGGKIPMLERGLFKAVDATMMMHPEGMYLVNAGGLALDALKFTFHGRASHAACTPHEGVNALDAMILFFNGVSVLRQQVKPDVRIHGIITKGGVFPNIIPDLTEADFYVRSEDRKYLDIVTEKVVKCAKGATVATGCRVEIKRFERAMDDVVNNPVLGRLVEKNLKALGVRDIVAKDEVPGSTDYGNVSRAVPSIYFYCATAPKGSELHTKEFAALSITDDAHRNMLISVKAMALSALDLFKDRTLLQKAVQNFNIQRR